ncbi:hypothetical protein PhaeoP72_01458 [Phaeobacter inhibens]|uniref:hypothetical protein n=1 Tax=Phaeobacter inhibens TaxID=221822 RepID=UPI000C99D984|nr:hypothetical protein [Phaeobacter inhibens]AUR03437.1 hypothetical protein PhaeoP72_01458 [Phaeobacter inhibens]
MRGEFCGVCSEIIDEIFVPLQDFDKIDGSLFLDLFRDTVPRPAAPIEPQPAELNEEGEIYLQGDIAAREAYEAAFAAYQDKLEAYNDASSHADLAREYLRTFLADQNTTELQIVKVLEAAFDVVEEFGGDPFANEYFNLLESFLDKFSLRYDLRRPANGNGLTLHPTLPGVFAKLVRDLRTATSQDEALALLMTDFEDSIRDLKDDRSSRRIRQCIEAEFKLLEELAAKVPGVERDSLGQMTHHIDSWPHATVRAAISNLYGFASNYPGIRHAGNPASRLREIDMRDMVAMTVVLAGFTPYLTDLLNADAIFAE